MREFAAPLTVYVTSDFAEGTGRLWWIALEKVIAKATAIEATIGGNAVRLDTVDASAKQAAFDRLHDWLRGLQEHDLRREMSALCARHGVDEAAICRDLCMSWDELKTVCRRSAGHDRRTHRQPLQPCPAERGAARAKN